MKVSSMNPTRRWHCGEVVAEVDEDVNKIPVCEVEHTGIRAAVNKTDQYNRK